jgi:hypothetical protein
MGASADGNTQLADQFEFLRTPRGIPRKELAGLAVFLCENKEYTALENLALPTILSAVVTSWKSQYLNHEMPESLSKRYQDLTPWQDLGFERIPLTVLTEAQRFERDCTRLFDLG